MPSFMVLRYAARSDVGAVRAKNDDSGYAGQYLAVVADGMGGHVGGDVASASTVLDLVHLDRDGYQGDAETQLADEIQTANSLLSEMVHVNPKLTGMGTTVTALLLSEGKLAFAHIGDSRAYRLKDGEFKQMSTDHTFVQRLIDEGRLTPEEAEVHPHKNVLMRVLGDVDASPELDLSSVDAEPGERWLLCSDGLNFVPLQVVEQVVRETASLSDTAEKLVELTLEAGAPDNVTAIVIEVAERSDQDTAKIDTAMIRAMAERQTSHSGSGRAVGAAVHRPNVHATGEKYAGEPLPDTGTIPEIDADAAIAAGDPAAVALDARQTDDAERGDTESQDTEYQDAKAQEAAAQEAAALDADPVVEEQQHGPEMLGEHIAADVVEEELAAREHELVGAAVTAYQEGKIPHIEGRVKHRPSAANLLTHGSESDEDDEVLVTVAPKRRSWITWVSAGVVVLVLVTAGVLGYAWTQTQYYVGAANGKVAIYNGVSQPLGPIQLSHVYSETSISLDSLTPFVKSRVEQTLPAGSLAEANQIVQDLQIGKVPSNGGDFSPSPSPSGSSSPSPGTTSSPASSAQPSPGGGGGQ